MNEPWHSPLRSRSVEMYLACVMTLAGMLYCLPGETLALPPYRTLAAIVAVFPGSEFTFGLLLLSVGALRLAALIVNGWWYPTPIVRIAGGLVGSFYWTALTVSFFDASLPTVPIALAWTISAIPFEIFSAIRSAADAHLYDSFGLRGRKRVRLASRHR